MAKDFKPTFRNSQEAFADAIARGHLSDNPEADNYAGHYMYMFTETEPGFLFDPSVKNEKKKGKRDAFKNIKTREYLFSVY